MGFQALVLFAIHVSVASSSPAECENVGLLQSQKREVRHSEMQLLANLHDKPKTAEEKEAAEFETKWKPLRALAKLLAEAKLNCYLHPSSLCLPQLKEYRKKVWPNIQAELGKNLTMFEPKGAESVEGGWRPFYLRTSLIGCKKTLTYLHMKQSPGKSVLTTLEKYSEPGSLSRGLMGDERMCNLHLEDDNKAFVFVRNPLTRFVDAYDDMLATEQVADTANLTREFRKPVPVGMSLLETKEESAAGRARRYIESFLQGGGGNLTPAVLPQSEYLAPLNNCSLQVGFFIKGEKKSKDWETLLKRKDCSHVAALPFLGEEEKTESDDSEESLLETLGSTSSGSAMKEALLADNGAYMRAFCWLSMPDYLLLDYDLPEPCLESDMGMVLDMAFTWKMDPDEVPPAEEADKTQLLQTNMQTNKFPNPVDRSSEALMDLAERLVTAKKECLRSSMDCLAALTQVRYRVWPYVQELLHWEPNPWEPTGYHADAVKAKMTCSGDSNYTVMLMHMWKAAGLSTMRNLEAVSESFVSVGSYLSDYRWCERVGFNSIDRHRRATFTFVREPLARLISGFAEIERSYHYDWLKTAPRGSIERAKVFIDRFFQDGALWNGHVKPQSEFFVPLSSKCGFPIDFVGKTENLDEDWHRFMESNRCEAASKPFDNGLGQHPTNDELRNSLEAFLEGGLSLVKDRSSALSHDSHLRRVLRRDNFAYLRAFCWVHFVDYIMFDYDLPKNCNQTEMLHIRDLTKKISVQ